MFEVRLGLQFDFMNRLKFDFFSLYSMSLITYLYIKLSHGNEELNPQLVICNSWNTTVTADNCGTGRNSKSRKYPLEEPPVYRKLWLCLEIPNDSSKWVCYAQNPRLVFLRFVSIWLQIKTQIKVFSCGKYFWLRL